MKGSIKSHNRIGEQPLEQVCRKCGNLYKINKEDLVNGHFFCDFIFTNDSICNQFNTILRNSNISDSPFNEIRILKQVMLLNGLLLAGLIIWSLLNTFFNIEEGNKNEIEEVINGSFKPSENELYQTTLTKFIQDFDREYLYETLQTTENLVLDIDTENDNYISYNLQNLEDFINEIQAKGRSIVIDTIYNPVRNENNQLVNIRLRFK